MLSNQMVTTRQNIDRLNMMMVYEANYIRLIQLIPRLKSISGTVISRGSDLPDIYLSILERGKYTTTVSLTHYLMIDGNIVPDLDMKIRVYHDAEVAEVIGYQHESRFASYYPYPNPMMRHHFEKRQINLFFSEWLKYCERCGIKFTTETNETSR